MSGLYPSSWSFKNHEISVLWLRKETKLYRLIALIWCLLTFFFFFFGGWQLKPEDHSHALPPPGKKGRTYICSCMLFLRPTEGAKLLMRAWIKELQERQWSPSQKTNDQPAFNWALNHTAGQVHTRTWFLLMFSLSSFSFGVLHHKI